MWAYILNIQNGAWTVNAFVNCLLWDKIHQATHQFLGVVKN